MLQNKNYRAIIRRVPLPGAPHNGMSPSGKAPDFDSGIRRFKSCHPSQKLSDDVSCRSVYDPLAQLAEQLPFKQWVWSSNLQRVTRRNTHLGIPLFVSNAKNVIFFF